MDRFAVWGLSAALVGALAPSAFGAEPAPPEAKSWMSRLVGSSEKKPEVEKTFAAVPARPPVVFGPPEPAVLAEAVRAEWDAFHRRMEVCLALRKVADKRNDDALFAQADELERQATAVRDQRLARLGVKSTFRAATTDTPPTIVAQPVPTDAGFRRVKP